MSAITLQGSGLTAQGLAIQLDTAIRDTGYLGDRKAARLAFASEAVERPIESFTDLSGPELSEVAHRASQGDLGAWLERHQQVGGEQRLFEAQGEPLDAEDIFRGLSEADLKRARWDARPGAPVPTDPQAAAILVTRLREQNRGLLQERDKWKRMYETERQHLLAVSGSAGGW